MFRWPSATIIRASRKNAKNKQETAQNAQPKPPDVRVNILNASCRHKIIHFVRFFVYCLCYNDTLKKAAKHIQ
jgi:hypothetical protein